MQTSARYEKELFQALASGAKSGPALQQALQLSQATLSRLIRAQRESILTLGAARSTCYAGKDQIAGIGASLPVYQIDDDGNGSAFARLHLLQGSQYGWELPGKNPQLLESLPPLITNMKPEGFMGKIFARQVAGDLNIPRQLEKWTERDMLVALSRRGEDGTGNLILGEESAARYMDQVRRGGPEIIEAAQRAKQYPLLAQKILTNEPFSSSAGGAQPKFTATVAHRQPTRVIVKFSTRKSDEGRRWSDLLVLEDIVNKTLTAAGRKTAETEIIQTADWTFLESRRFDRHQLWGRSPLCTLAAIIDEYINDSWGTAAEKLKNNKLFDGEQLATAVWLEDYGTLIGNNDMHFGNLSLIPTDNRYLLAPVYDMAPMIYAPRSGWPLSFEPLQPQLHRLTSDPAELLQAASQFWSTGAKDERISEKFRALCHKNLNILTEIPRQPLITFS